VLTAERLRELLAYDPETGAFTWLVSLSRNVPAGRRAGSVRRDGYAQVCIGGVRYMAHTLAWFYVHGEWRVGGLDHVNGDRADNRLANLRRSSPAQNSANSRCHADNVSGFKGVSWHKPTSRWNARIRTGGVNRSLGYFDTPEEAHAAYAKAALEHHGEFARP
jgi:hypothetical protein